MNAQIPMLLYSAETRLAFFLKNFLGKNPTINMIHHLMRAYLVLGSLLRCPLLYWIFTQLCEVDRTSSIFYESQKGYNTS